jgi:hypothetical protein
MLCGGSDHGLVRCFKAASDARFNSELYEQGHNEFRQRHLRLAHGAHGVGRFAVPDASPALRYFLAFNQQG